MKKFKKLCRKITGYFSSTCECCAIPMLNKNRILLATVNGNVFYKGAGICGKCHADKMIIALSDT